MEMDPTSFPSVAKDFPVTAHISAVAGAQPKMGLIEEGGKFYAPGRNEQEVTYLAHFARQLILRHTTLDKEFAGFVYDKACWINDQSTAPTPFDADTAPLAGKG